MQRTPSSRVGAFLFVVGLVTACRAPNAAESSLSRPTPIASCQSLIFFGTNLGDKPYVTADQWDRFLAEDVLPHFPSGFTSLDGVGYWSATNAPIREASHVLVIVHPYSDEADRGIDAICRSYKTKFRQESVLRVDTRAEMLGY